MSLYIIIPLYAAVQIAHSQLICEQGYTCYEDPTRNIVWVKKDAGNTNGPSCKSVCESALLNNNVFHACDRNQPLIHDIESFDDIATGLGFTCRPGGCWDSNAPGEGMILVKNGDNTDKTCYFPNQDDTTITKLTCTGHPGNANCFGERYSIICPCVAKALDEACVWAGTTNIPQVATWPTNIADGDATSCIDRINYWRKVACADNWIECPPAGLPPMTECTCCHNCANSQSEHDKTNGAHKSFKRCGDMSQGQGGGSNCAAVIDAFVRERSEDENGVMRCTGHCGPIVAKGCQTFFWGEYNGFHTLNWRTCNVEKCEAYCNDPSENACFASSSDIEPDMSTCSGYAAMNDDSVGVIGYAFISVFAVLLAFFVFVLIWKKCRAGNDDDLKGNVNKSIKNSKKKKGKKSNGKKGETKK